MILFFKIINYIKDLKITCKLMLYQSDVTKKVFKSNKKKAQNERERDVQVKQTIKAAQNMTCHVKL